MELAKLQQKIVEVAKANPPSEAVPYLFEKRIMARLAPLPVADLWSQWSRMLWKAAAPSLAASLALAAWVYFAPAEPPDYSDALEGVVLAGFDHVQSSW